MHVLVGVDDSELGRKALEDAITRAVSAGDELTVAVYGSASSRAELEAEITERLEAAGLEPSLRHLDGEPGSQLVHFADSEGYDRLVVAGGGRTPMGKIRLGPVAEFVLLNAETTVTVVR